MARGGLRWLAGLALVGVAACGGVEVGGIPPPEGPYPSRELELEYEGALAAAGHGHAGPAACALGAMTSAGGYVVALAPWAEDAGLRPGDQITAIGGQPTTSPDARGRALHEVPPGGPLVISVRRHGQPLALTLPCREQLRAWAAARRLRQAIAQKDWDACIAAARQLVEAQGFAGSVNLASEFNCMHARDLALGRRVGQPEAELAYEWSRQRLRESRYVPGSGQEARQEVARVVAELRKWSFADLATELEARLR